MKKTQANIFIKLYRYVLNIFLPRVCLSCKQDLHYLSDLPLCQNCLAELEYLQKPYCERCGLPLEFSRGYCYDCENKQLPLNYLRSALVYNDVLKPLVHSLKYTGHTNLARFLAGEMAKAYDYFPEIKDHDYLVPVPLHKNRLKTRGYNQAELLANELANLKGLKVLPNAVIRIIETPTQTKLSRKKREKNIRGAFSVPNPALIAGKKLLLIDDIATTLSTLNELALVLKEAGAGSISAYTLAREP